MPRHLKVRPDMQDSTAREFRYCNPHQGPHPGNVRDPFILNHAGRYYLTATLAPFWYGPCPGVPLWSSDDLLTWQPHGLLIDRQTIGPAAWYRDRFWAPEIHAAPSGFYLTFNAQNETTHHKHAIAIARADDVTGPYRVLNPDRPIPAFTPRHYTATDEVGVRYVANDGSLFTDTDGTSYLFWCHLDGIWASRIDLPNGQLLGERFLVIPPAPGEWDGMIEGPCVMHAGEFYYLFYSGYSRSYEMGVARARRIMGPWVRQPNNPVATPKLPITHAGHNCIFTGPDGGRWICYHQQQGKDTTEYMCYDPIRITPDGWVQTDAPTLGPRCVPCPG